LLFFDEVTAQEQESQNSREWTTTVSLRNCWHVRNCQVTSMLATQARSHGERLVTVPPKVLFPQILFHPENFVLKHIIKTKNVASLKY